MCNNFQRSTISILIHSFSSINITNYESKFYVRYFYCIYITIIYKCIHLFTLLFFSVRSFLKSFYGFSMHTSKFKWIGLLLHLQLIKYQPRILKLKKKIISLKSFVIFKNTISFSSVIKIFQI